MDQSLVLAGLSALTDGIVMTYDDYQRCDVRIYKKCGELNIRSLFEKYHVYVGQPRPEIILPVAGEMAIFVKLPTEETATFYVSTDGTVKDLMDKINERVGIPAEQFFIIFGCKQLNDPDRKLRDYSIQPESTVYVLLRLRGGAINAYFTNDLDPEWDYDFMNISDGNRVYAWRCRVQATVWLETIRY
jgi:hypothetical protein